MIVFTCWGVCSRIFYTGVLSLAYWLESAWVNEIPQRLTAMIQYCGFDNIMLPIISIREKEYIFESPFSILHAFSAPTSQAASSPL